MKRAQAEAEANRAGVCRRCRRVLTDPISKALGIGPVCRSRQAEDMQQELQFSPPEKQESQP